MKRLCEALYDCIFEGKKDRPCWDCYFLELAKVAALRGDCIRKKVGAVLVRPDHRAVITGYNGSEPGGPSCLEGECERCLSDVPAGTGYEGCVEYHAEHNALMWARPEDRIGATLFVTFEPCTDCRKLIRGVGVSSVVWLNHGSLIRRWSI
ncbi:deoxycytidylate deaminase [Streptomyces argyrophylli]|uniref:deoxycytidylate deaminase n=1 Tax=Streptomyces argyrophylli TaxID=2726118 RepID=UPI001BB0D95F|nr:deaminase [Streptomyces argyrophyllae]